MRPTTAAINVGLAAAVAALVLALSAGEAGATTYYHVDAPAAENRMFLLGGQVKAGAAKRVTAGFASRDMSAFTIYSARSASRATRQRIRARVPRLGHVAVRFHERRTRRVVERFGRCKLVMVSRVGRFTGIIDVRGDGGYEGVDRRSARGGYDRLEVHGCGRRARPLSIPRRARTGALVSCVPHSPTGFVALARPARTIFLASTGEQLGRLRILRQALAVAPGRSAFHIGPGFRSAQVRPPGPWFAGDARYSSRRLTGDLTASFIGAADVPLVPGPARLTGGLRFPSRCGGDLPVVLAGRGAAPAGSFSVPFAAAFSEIGVERRQTRP